MLGTLNDSTILRLRVKGSDLDPLALRGRLESVLNDVSLQPRLPPTATVFIRKLADPLPGLIQLDHPHARAPLAWRHAFQTRFDQVVASAARPAHGFVADSAESVVFYDYAELLASLTADWCRGIARTRWWWQALLRRGDIAQMIRRFWREKVEYVPAALEFLVSKGVVVEFVSRLSDVEVLEIFERVVHVFGVTRITPIKATDFFSVAVAREVVREVAHVATVQREMPWRPVVPESDTPRLRPVQQLFVGVVLMIHRAPSRVRTERFAREVEQWITQVVSAVVDEQTIDENKIEFEFLSTPEILAPIRENPIPEIPAVRNAEPPPKESVKSTVKEFEAVTPLAPIPETERLVQTPPSPPESPSPSPPPSKPIVTVSADELLETVTIKTELGGLFYLINLALFMEIYSDNEFGIWDFVTIVGKEIDQKDDDDPIWGLLRTFAGRDDEDELITPPWLADLLPHIRARLHLALGIDEDLAQILLHHHAKIFITATHLDVFFSLGDHPIEIRLSGLDRNPGWVPDAGRFIAFHYD